MLRLFLTMTNIENVERTAQDALDQIHQAAPSELDALRVRYLGRKGLITAFLKGLGAMDPDRRAAFGKAANVARGQVEAALQSRLAEAGSPNAGRPGFDASLPGRRDYPGTRHPITHTLEEIVSIFARMGFVVADGPDVETRTR